MVHFRVKGSKHSRTSRDLLRYPPAKNITVGPGGRLLWIVLRVDTLFESCQEKQKFWYLLVRLPLCSNLPLPSSLPLSLPHSHQEILLWRVQFSQLFAVITSQMEFKLASNTLLTLQLIALTRLKCHFHFDNSAHYMCCLLLKHFFHFLIILL